MIAEVTAVAFRQRLGEMLSHVQYGGDSVLVTKDGSPVAALIDAALFNQIRTFRSRFDELCGTVAAGYSAVPEEQGLSEIDRLVAAERHGR